MINMKILIRIVLVIFITNGIDCRGSICDDCCDYFKGKNKEKEEYDRKLEEEKINEKINEKIISVDEIKGFEEIEGDGNFEDGSLVSKNWYKNNVNNPILKIFRKKNSNTELSTENEDKILINLENKSNIKLFYLQKKSADLNVKDKKWAFFEIEKEKEETVYLYCSNVESFYNRGIYSGIFKGMKHKNIYVIACDVEKVNDMSYMFNLCKNLEKLDLKNFNITNIEKMQYMFAGCTNLKNIELGKNINTEEELQVNKIFDECNSLSPDFKNEFLKKIKKI